MASWVLSECGIRPFPSQFLKPRTGFTTISSRIPVCKVSGSRTDSSRIWVQSNGGRSRDWGLKVNVPMSVPSEEEENKSSVNGVDEEDNFDPGAPPPFDLAEIRAAIPKHCWVKDTWKSMSYVVRDVIVVFGLAAVAASLNNWIVWPLYWVAQGTMFWALFILGHDCGHGSFSNNHKLNSVVGHILHSSILVPYNGWRISHRTHHQNIGHVENDESWIPMPESLYRSLDDFNHMMRFTLPAATLVFPFYLAGKTFGNRGSHYDPNSLMFVPNERKDVITSTVCYFAMVALLVGLSFVMGPVQMLKLYGIPYWIFVMLLDVVTYLHHHGYEDKVPWYRGKEWTPLRGGLTTIDRDYGVINNIHHNAGTHVIHHLFPQIPHYNTVEATEAAKPVLGKYYREPKKSGFLPFHLVDTLIKSFRSDHYVSDEGEILYYQTDPELAGTSKKSE